MGDHRCESRGTGRYFLVRSSRPRQGRFWSGAVGSGCCTRGARDINDTVVARATRANTPHAQCRQANRGGYSPSVSRPFFDCVVLNVGPWRLLWWELSTRSNAVTGLGGCRLVLADGVVLYEHQSPKAMRGRLRLSVGESHIERSDMVTTTPRQSFSDRLRLENVRNEFRTGRKLNQPGFVFCTVMSSPSSCSPRSRCSVISTVHSARGHPLYETMFTSTLVGLMRTGIRTAKCGAEHGPAAFDGNDRGCS